jgi:hypothetical protein
MATGIIVRVTLHGLDIRDSRFFEVFNRKH